MKRILSQIHFMALVVALLVGVAGGAQAASAGGALEPANTVLGDRASLQRGAKLFMNYCLSCHSARFMRYARMGEDLGLSEADVQGNLNFTGAKYGEIMVAAMSAEDGERWFGKAPPDLSVTSRAKGVDWIYTYLKTFYLDDKRPSGWNNPVLPGSSMPNPLWDLQGTQRAVFEPKHKAADGKTDEPCHSFEVDGQCLAKLVKVSDGRMNEEQFDQAARDITAFMQYVGEPAAIQRHAYGPWVILFLALFTFIAWMLKHEYWRDVH